MDSQPVSQSYTVPACNLPQLGDRIATLNKRARKLGVAEIVLAVVWAYRAIRITKDGSHRWHRQEDTLPPGFVPTGEVMDYHTATVTGEAPRYAGWSFVATLEPIQGDDGSAVNLLQCVPGQICPAEYRARVGQCDHCQAKRRRNQTFVVRNEQGEHRMVGRNCLRDFLGHTDPHRLAAWAEWLAELDSIGHSAEDEGWGGGSGGGSNGFDLLHVLAWTAGVIARYGWVSRSYARENEKATATADRVWHLLRRPFKPSASELREWEQEREKCQPTETHRADAEAAREWARAFSDEQIDTNNYLANCNAIARAGFVEGKTAGVACSILSSFQREQARLLVQARRSNEHVGTVGKRESFVVTVERVLSIEGRFGTQGLHKMLDPAGNALVWWASGGANWLTEGKTYRVEASVKEHDDYKGRKQTNLTRVTVKGEVTEAKPALVPLDSIPF